MTPEIWYSRVVAIGCGSPWSTVWFEFLCSLLCKTSNLKDDNEHKSEITIESCLLKSLPVYGMKCEFSVNLKHLVPALTIHKTSWILWTKPNQKPQKIVSMQEPTFWFELIQQMLVNWNLDFSVLIQKHSFFNFLLRNNHKTLKVPLKANIFIANRSNFWAPSLISLERFSDPWCVQIFTYP